MTAAVVKAERLSRWYGHVLGISEVNLELTGGVIGLLGPNGAGKSTLIKMMAGLLRPSRGTLTVFGASPFESLETRRRIGYAPEHEQTWNELSGLELVTAMARLAGVPASESRAAAERALAAMGMTDAMHRRVRGYSKGMRQRAKLATAIAHDPDFILLDEPLTGVDPMARTDIIAKIRTLGAAGKTVLVSSHVLYEIEALTTSVVVIQQGQVLAEGNVQAIRKLVDKHPHRIKVECSRGREVAQKLLASDHIAHVQFDRQGFTLETRDPDRCYDELSGAMLELGVDLVGLSSPDNNLAALFDYLTRSAR